MTAVETDRLKEGGGESLRRVGLRGPLLLFLECSPGTVRSRKAERLFLGRQTHSCFEFEFSSPFFLWPWLFGAMELWRGGSRSGGLVR